MIGTTDVDSLAELTTILGGARALAHRVWDAGWRPTRCGCCGAPVNTYAVSPGASGEGLLCSPCALVASTMQQYADPDDEYEAAYWYRSAA